MIVAPGATSISVDVFFADDSGAAVTGKAAADFPACKWSGGANTADTTITLSDLGAITTAHPNDNTAGGVKEREGGWYRLDLPNNMFSSGGRKTLTFAESAGKRIIAPSFDVQYVSADLQTIKTQSVTCAAGVTMGAYVGNATHAIAVDASGNVTLAASQTFNNTGTWTGNVSGSVGSVTAAVTLPSIPANWITAAGIAATALTGKGDWLLASSYTTPPTAAAIATQVELQIMDDTDSRAVLQAIVDKINAADPDLGDLSLAAIASAVATQITSDHGSGSYVRNTEPDNATIGDIYSALGTPMQAGAYVQLAATQPNWAPAKTGDKMDLINTPNATAVSAIQSGLATSGALTTAESTIIAHGDANWEGGGGDGGGSGAGNRTVIVTVNDRTNPLQAVEVIAKFNGIEVASGVTDPSGQTTLHLDDGSYTIVLVLTGWIFAPTTLIVSSEAPAPIYGMTQIIIPPASDPTQTNAWLYTKDGSGALDPGRTITFQMIRMPSSIGVSFDGGEFQVTSDESTSLLQTPLEQSAGYRYRQGNGPWVYIYDTGTDPTLELQNVLGSS